MSHIDWWLDITEYHSSPAGLEEIHKFSAKIWPGGAWVDPYESEGNPHHPQTVVQFIAAVNRALTAAADRGADGELSPYWGASGTNRTYRASAKLTQVDATEDVAYIQYEIECLSGDPGAIGAGGDPSEARYRRFSIDFNSGPHNTHDVHWDVAGNIDENTFAEIEVINRPYPVVGTFPAIASATVSVQDDPPIEPDVEFVPYNGVNNKILLLISGQTGQKYTWPVLIKPSDEAKIANTYLSQGITDTVPNAPMRFKSDDPVTTFQIFRTTEPPTLYSDFEGRQLAEYTEYSGPEGQSLAAYIDETIIPNTKYYYCFRAVDVHDNVSNPGPVIEFEMVDNNGQIYPIINHYYGCGDRDEQSFVKTGKRFVYIAPSTRQLVLDADYVHTAASGFTTGSAPMADMLGPTGVWSAGGAAFGTSMKVWNNIFKIRVTSKKTGRKIDLNLVFKNRGVIDP